MNKPANILLVSVFVLAATQSQAIVLNIDASDDGFSNAPFTNENFWGVNFVSDSIGGIHVTEVSIDLRADGQNLSGVFDLVGGSGSPFGPMVGSATSGLIAGDVTFTPNSGTNFSVLTLSFAAGSFTAGDSLRFGADLDSMDVSDGTAETLGQTGVGYNVSFSDGSSQSGAFVDDGVNDGFASTTVVPEPSAYGLLAGLIALAIANMRARRR